MRKGEGTGTLKSQSMFGFPREITRNSRGKGNFYQSDVISATEILQFLYYYGTEIPRKFRGNTK